MERKETVGRTLLVMFILCVVCSAVVATTAVLLKPAQRQAMENDRNIYILRIGGLYEPGIPLADQFEQVTPKVVDLETGKFSDEMKPEQAVDARKVSRDPATSIKLDTAEDQAKLIRRENYGLVYLVEKEGELDRLILPIRGYGLWSTLWGFIALEADLNTIVGLGFYQHAETPGLGGEVDNPRWQAQWVGKELFDDGTLAIKVLKGTVDPDSPNAVHQVDGLAGATITSRGVDHMLHYWFSEQGYGKFLENLKSGEA
ncbi:MAG: Na(+)-translocating NADH-quinone reductase subunit C [Porticoccaceae bacterium]